MPPSARRQLTSRQADRKVKVRAQRLSDELLLEEEVCFRNVAAVLAHGVPPARKLVAASFGKTPGKSLSWDRELVTKLQIALAGAVRDSTSIVLRLIATSRSMTLDAVGDQLRAIEATASLRYDGAADVGVTRAAESGLEQLAMEMYADAATRVVGTFGPEARQQIALVVARGEELKALEARLFSPDPLSMFGNGGRGVWFRSISSLQASARGASIGLVNGLQHEAMRGMNEEIVSVDTPK